MSAEDEHVKHAGHSYFTEGGEENAYHLHKQSYSREPTSITPAVTNLAPESLVSLRDRILANDRTKNTQPAQFKLVRRSKCGLQDFEENKADFTDGVEDDGD